MTRTLWTIAATVLLTLVAAAAGLDDPRTERDVTVDATPRARLLHLVDGQVVRGRASFVDGTWDVDLGPRHVSIEGERVERVVLESDVLRQMRRLERGLDRGADPRRLSLVRWLVTEGLVAEALGHVDRILEADPDHAGALAVLAARPPATLAGAPGPEASEAEARDTWLRLGMRSRPSGRELVIAELADDARPAELRAALLEELHDRHANHRRFAAVALRRLFPGQGVSDLQGRAIFDVDDEVRRQAVYGLRSLEAGDEVLQPFLRALESDVAIVRRQAIEALGMLGHAAAAPALFEHLAALNARAGANFKPPRAHIFTGRQIAYVMDYDVEIAQGASIADPVIGVLQEGNVLDVAAYGATIQRTIVLERQVLHASLRDLTGADPGRSDEHWLRWWDEHRDR